MNKVGPILILIAALVVAATAPNILAVGQAPTAERAIPAEVRSVFAQRCAGCHKGARPPMGLSLEADRLASMIDAPSRQVPTLKIVDTEAPESSYLLKKVRRESGIVRRPMPPGRALSSEELKTLESWVNGLKGLARPDVLVPKLPD